MTKIQLYMILILHKVRMIPHRKKKGYCRIIIKLNKISKTKEIGTHRHLKVTESEQHGERERERYAEEIRAGQVWWRSLRSHAQKRAPIRQQQQQRRSRRCSCSSGSCSCRHGGSVKPPRSISPRPQLLRRSVFFPFLPSKPQLASSLFA